MSRRDSQRGLSEIVVFGRHPVKAALASSGASVLDVKVMKSLSNRDRKELRVLAEKSGASYEELSRSALDVFTAAPRHDQGIAARVRLLRVIEVDSFLLEGTGRAARKPLRLIGLDGVTNSQNVGMVVRSIVGAGLDGLLWPLVGQPWVNGLVIRAAAGALFECPIIRCETLLDGLISLRGAGFTVYGLDAEAEKSVFEAEVEHRTAYLLGSESRGLSEAVRSLVDAPVSIPMAGALESLNVAVAAGLVCFHAADRLGGNSGLDR